MIHCNTNFLYDRKFLLFLATTNRNTIISTSFCTLKGLLSQVKKKKKLIPFCHDTQNDYKWRASVKLATLAGRRKNESRRKKCRFFELEQTPCIKIQRADERDSAKFEGQGTVAVKREAESKQNGQHAHTYVHVRTAEWQNGLRENRGREQRFVGRKERRRKRKKKKILEKNRHKETETKKIVELELADTRTGRDGSGKGRAAVGVKRAKLQAQQYQLSSS